MPLLCLLKYCPEGTITGAMLILLAVSCTPAITIATGDHQAHVAPGTINQHGAAQIHRVVPGAHQAHVAAGASNSHGAAHKHRVDPGAKARASSTAAEDRLQSALLRLEGDGRRHQEGRSSWRHSTRSKTTSEASLTALSEYVTDTDGVVHRSESDTHADRRLNKSSAEKRRIGHCKVPLFAESVSGSGLGARRSLCLDDITELQEGQACDTACAKWYKVPDPERVFCSCDETGQACSLQPVADSADVAPVMMNFVRCPVSLPRLMGAFVFFAVLLAVPIVFFGGRLKEMATASMPGAAAAPSQSGAPGHAPMQSTQTGAPGYAPMQTMQTNTMAPQASAMPGQ